MDNRFAFLKKMRLKRNYLFGIKTDSRVFHLGNYLDQRHFNGGEKS